MLQWKRKRERESKGTKISVLDMQQYLQCNVHFTSSYYVGRFFPCSLFFFLRLCSSWTLHKLIDFTSPIWISFATFALCVSLIKPSVSTYLIGFPSLSFLLSSHFSHWFLNWFPDLAAIATSSNPGGIEWKIICAKGAFISGLLLFTICVKVNR